MGDRLTTVDMGRKVGAAVPVSVWELGPHNTVSPAPRPTSIPNDILIHEAVWSQNRDGRKVGAALLCPFPWGSWVPSNTMSLKPIFKPSGTILRSTYGGSKSKLHLFMAATATFLIWSCRRLRRPKAALFVHGLNIYCGHQCSKSRIITWPPERCEVLGSAWVRDIRSFYWFRTFTIMVQIMQWVEQDNKAQNALIVALICNHNNENMHTVLLSSNTGIRQLQNAQD